MATKRDRKTAFPFIKPKGSIKKDIQHYRSSLSSKSEVSEATTPPEVAFNPVQRRESSASRFLKHFRPDRNNPAYHSEGKGLRKKRQPWTSERELPQLSDRKPPPITSKDRSRSFGEQDAIVQLKMTPNGKENLVKESGRESFRWRFRKSDKNLSKGKLEPAPSVDQVDHCVRQEMATQPGAPGSPNQQQECQSAASGQGDTKLAEEEDDEKKQPWSKQDEEPVYCNTTSNDAPPPPEADYVNLEVVSKSSKSEEPDLLQNLPSECNKESSASRLRSSAHVLGRSFSVSNPGVSANQSLQNFHTSSDSVFEVSDGSAAGDAAARRHSRPTTMHYGFTRSTPNLDTPALHPKMASQWDWTNAAAGDEEMNYASQLRSSMATLLNAHSHMRQASTNSTSSNFSSYSADETFTGAYHDPNQNVTPTRKFSADNSSNSNNHPGVGVGMCSALSGSSYEAFHQDLDLYCKQYGGWMDADSIGIPPPPPPASLSPPPPPVRDSSSLKYIKYGPGHEKHPSWPMPGALASCAQSQSQRSKSWTEQTDYPKDPAPAYVRPHSKRLNPVYSQQLKTVLENCERIPPETFQPKSLDNFSSANYLPNYDCDGHAIDDKDYNIPSPPERDVGNLSSLASDADYAKYEDIQQYSHSEGYSSYVPSESSYVSVSGTPLLDQLRRDSDAQVINAKEKEVKDAGAHTGRDSVTTVVTNSSSNSSNETLRWHGSYSDISVMSGSSSRLDSNAIVVHSAKVQAPQRHHSESILYYAPEHPKSRPSWSGREKNQHWKKKPAKRAEPVTSSTNEKQELFSVVDTSQPPSVQERIHQLERQSKSVPNLAERWRAADRNQQQQQRSRHNLSLANGGQSINVDKDDSSKVHYTFLDPEKRLKVADPTLKAIQRQALMSYYERYTKGSGSGADHGGPTCPKEATSPPPRSSPDSFPFTKNESATTSRASVPNPSSSIPAHTASEPCAPVRSEPVQQAGLVPPERPPKKPHLRPRQPPIIPDNELRRIEASAKELINLNHSRTSPRRKPPAPDPPPTPPPPPPPPPSCLPPAPQAASPGPQIPPTAPVAAPSPLISVSTATNPLVPEVSKPLVRRTSSQSWENSAPVSAEAPARMPSPDLPPPPPPSPPPSSAGEACAAEEPLPPPPSPLAIENTNQETVVPDRASPKSPTYHKESYMVHRKNMGLLHRHSADNLLSIPDRSLSPTSWDQEHSIRKGSSSTAVMFSAEDVRTDSEPKSFISQVTFQTELNVPLPVVEPHQPLVHTYRAVAQSNAERFAYLRKISSGDWSRGPKEANPDPQDPPPTKSPGVVGGGAETPVRPREVEKSREEPLPVIRSVAQPKISTLPRPKRPEELECDQLSKDLICHLSPSDKLHALLRVPGPDHPTTTRIVEGLFEQPIAAAVCAKTSATTTTSTPTTSPSKVDSCTQLPLTSAYFTTSEPKAKLLARYGSDIISEQNKEPVNSDVLLKKKEDLMMRLGKKLEVLRSERLLVQEEVESNEELGRTVQSKVAAVATTPESNKVALHVAEVDKITSLLLALAGRLARAQNALLSLPTDAEPQEKAVLEGKRDKLVEQLEEAKRLKENIDRRSVQVAALLSKYLDEEEFADYTHFVTMKAKLVMDTKEIDDKIKLGEEQLAALRETLHVRPRI